MSGARRPRRVFVVFEAADVAAVARTAREGDVVFGEVAEREIANARYVRPELRPAAVGALAEQARGWFGELQGRLGLDVEALVNPFFEASILPIATYANALADLLAASGPANVEVVFPRRISSRRRTSTFLLAEHEVHRRLLYRRHQVFQPYLEELCERLGVPSRSLGDPEGMSLALSLPLRRYFTLAMRIGAAVIKAVTLPRFGEVVAEQVDVVGVARNPSKSEFLHPLLTLPGLRSCLVVGELFTSVRRNARFSAGLYRGTTVRLLRLPSLGVSDVLGVYGKAWSAGRQLADDDCVLDTGVVSLRLANAVREMLVTYPDAELHAKSLRDVLSRVRPTRRLVLSTEQKSQYAWGDAQASRATGNLCFHLMEVDQSDRPLPAPVFGDLFVASSLQHQARFQEAWPRWRERVAYFGPLKPWLPDHEIAGDGVPRWCFFTSADPALDRRVLNALQGIADSGEIALLVKLHPRDSILHYGMFPRAWFVKDGSVSKQQLFARFDFGLSFSSAIIADLFAFAKPFLLLDIADEEFFNQSVHRDRLPDLRVTNAESLPGRMRDIVAVARAFRAYRAAYLAELGGPAGASEFLARMNEAARRLEGGIPT